MAKNKTLSFLGELDEKEAEKIFTAGKGFEFLPTPETPIFVLLFGSPGSGKSTALQKMERLTGLDPKDAVQINLDSLVESLEPFREKTHEIATRMLKEKGTTMNTASQKNINEIAGKTSGPYLSYIRTKKNNRPGYEGDELPYSLNDLRFLLLKKALEEGKNIIYERTVSSSAKDIFEDEVFSKIEKSGHPYKVYVIYTKITVQKNLEGRLMKRPGTMMKRNPPFFRGVPSSLAGKFITAHEEYFEKYLAPKIESGKVDGFVLNSSGKIAGGGSRKTRRQRRR